MIHSPSLRHWLALLSVAVLATVCSALPIGLAQPPAPPDGEEDGTRAIRIAGPQQEPGLRQVFEPLAADAPRGNAGLFVGVNRFEKDRGLSDLVFAVHDAVELAHLFVFELNLIPAENCVVLLSGPPSTDERSRVVGEHLAKLRRAGATIGEADRTEILLSFIRQTQVAKAKSDLLVTSFSSHGFEDRGDAYVMPSDGVKALLSDTAVPLKTIEGQMRNSEAGHRLLLVDACQERVPARSTARAAAPVAAAFVRAFSQATGQAKLASCSSGQFSHEVRIADGPGHGLFTAGILRALRGGATPDASGVVRLGEVAEYVTAFVSDWSSEQGRTVQTPLYEGPVPARQLPLASRADDLTALLLAFRADRAGALPPGTKSALLEHLEDSPLTDPRDLELIAAIRDYSAGKIGAGLLTAYVERDASRWNPEPVRPPPPVLLRSPFSAVQAQSAGRGWAAHLGVPTIVTDKAGVRLKLVPAGSFTMGSGEQPPAQDEKPHRVTITEPFYVSEHEITVGQFRRFVESTGYRTDQERDRGYVRGWDAASRRFTNGLQFDWRNPGWPRSDDHPVVHVTFNDGRAFAEWLSRTENATYRLPTEAEWEYCCRAGTTTRYSTGEDKHDLVRVGNVLDNTGMSQFASDWQFRQNNANQLIPRNDGVAFTAAVGRYRANAFGLHDFHGNVCEWTGDWFTEAYDQLAERDPEGAAGGTQRSARGGRFDTGGGLAKSYARNRGAPTMCDMILGLRLVREIEEAE